MELGVYLPYLVNRVGQLFVGEFTPALARHGADVQTWRVLSVLHQHGDQPVGALSALTAINMSTLSRLVGRMEARGMVRRRRGEDARRVIVGITRAGRRITESLIPIAQALEERATEGLTRAEAATLRDLLARLYDTMAENAGDSWPQVSREP